MAIRLYDYALSGSCYKVRLLMGFIGLPYTRELVDFFPGKQHRMPDFLAINPLGQLPVLDDDGFCLHDAQAILCYLAKKYDASGRWLPEATQDFAEVMMWLMFANSELTPASTARLHDLMGYPADIALVRKQAHNAYRVLDDHLVRREIEGGTWIVGEHPTIADVACFPYVALAGDGGMTHDDYPALRNWMRSFRSLPGFHAMSGVPEFV